MSTGMGKGNSILQQIKQLFAVKQRPVSNEFDEEDCNEIQNVVLRMNGVIAIESCIAREHGHYVVATLIINVNPKISVQEGHEIGQRVRWLLMHRFTHLSEAIVHVKPFAPEYPYKSNDVGALEDNRSLLQ